MDEIYKVIHEPNHRWGKWACVNALDIVVWRGNDEAFIRQFATDPAYRWSIIEDCIRASELRNRLAKGR